MGLVFPSRQHFSVPLPSGRVLELGERCLVMGVLNLTPDSFAERIRLDAANVVEVALKMEEDGADLLDVGGESTRPGGAIPVSEDEEMARVLPAIRALARRVRVPLSVDTQKAAVARAAVLEGAAIVNDVSALEHDREMGVVVANAGAALLLMHNRPANDMYARALYDDVVGEVKGELAAAVAKAEACGIGRERLMIDPGIGFAKRPPHSYGVLAGAAEIARDLGLPIVIGPSRKSFMSAALGSRPAVDRDWGTAAAVTAAVLAGAHVVRVHAVPEMVQVVRVAEEIRRHS